MNNPKFLEMGPANVYLFIKPRARLLYGSGDAGVFLEARYPGADGNNITFTVQSGDLTENDGKPIVEVSGSTGDDIVVTVDGSLADEVIAAIAGSSAASLVQPTRLSGGDGSGVVATGGPSSLTGGSDTGVKTGAGFLGEGLLYKVKTDANPLLGAQTGNVAQDKVITGGEAMVVLPFKEISFDNLQRGVPSARKVVNDDGSLKRIDFAVAVGQSMRRLAMKMQIIKIVGGFESTRPNDVLNIPEISPAEGEVGFPYHPTTQREINTNWYAWPDATTNRWAFIGNENV